MAHNKETFLVVGFGNFGQTVAKHALLAGYKVKLYLRSTSFEKRKQQIDELAKLGSLELLEGTLDDSDLDKLREAVKHVDVVVSTISVDNPHDSDEVVYKNYMKETNLIKAVEGIKLKRFITNEWSLPSKPELGPLFAAKSDLIQLLKKSNIPYTNIYVGMLTEIAPFFTGAVFGSGDGKVILTTLEDIGRITVKAIFDERTKNKPLYIRGDELTQKEILQITGKDIHTLPKYSHEDIIKKKEENKKSNIMTIQEAYLEAIFFDKVEDPNILYSGDLYPEEKLTKLKEFKGKIIPLPPYRI